MQFIIGGPGPRDLIRLGQRLRAVGGGTAVSSRGVVESRVGGELQALGQAAARMKGASPHGAAMLAGLGADLKNLGAADLLQPSAVLGTGKTLRAQLLAGIRTGVKPAVEATRQAARDTLPKAGGLNEYIATEKITTSTRTTGPRVGVRVVAKGGWGSNHGNVRHPVFGDRKRWVQQPISTSGWFEDTLNSHRPQMQAAVHGAMKVVAEEVTRRLH